MRTVVVIVSFALSVLALVALLFTSMPLGSMQPISSQDRARLVGGNKYCQPYGAKAKLNTCIGNFADDSCTRWFRGGTDCPSNYPAWQCDYTCTQQFVVPITGASSIQIDDQTPCPQAWQSVCFNGTLSGCYCDNNNKTIQQPCGNYKSVTEGNCNE
jgi:hypothetical protein